MLQSWWLINNRSLLLILVAEIRKCFKLHLEIFPPAETPLTLTERIRFISAYPDHLHGQEASKSHKVPHLEASHTWLISGQILVEASSVFFKVLMHSYMVGRGFKTSLVPFFLFKEWYYSHHEGFALMIELPLQCLPPTIIIIGVRIWTWECGGT